MLVPGQPKTGDRVRAGGSSAMQCRQRDGASSPGTLD